MHWYLIVSPPAGDTRWLVVAVPLDGPGHIVRAFDSEADAQEEIGRLAEIELLEEAMSS